MTGAIAGLDDFSRWARGNFLVIVLLVLGAILLTRLAGWVRDKIMAHIESKRDALHINTQKERKMYDMKSRRELQ